MDDSVTLVVGLVVAFPIIVFFLKSWLFATGTPGSTARRVTRIAELDGHLSFDERLADKLRGLEQEQQGSPEPPFTPPPEAAARAAPRSFGRRGL